MHNSAWSSRLVVGAALVGLVGAAGMFLYEQLYAERRRDMLLQEVARLESQVSSMKTELDTLRELQKENQLKRLKQKKIREERAKRRALQPTGDQPEVTYASDSEYFTDYQSVLGTDAEMDSEEFFDVHSDDEDDTLRESILNGMTAPDSLTDEELSENNVTKPSADNAT